MNYRPASRAVPGWRRCCARSRSGPRRESAAAREAPLTNTRNTTSRGGFFFVQFSSKNGFFFSETYEYDTAFDAPKEGKRKTFRDEDEGTKAKKPKVGIKKNYPLERKLRSRYFLASIKFNLPICHFSHCFKSINPLKKSEIPYKFILLYLILKFKLNYLFGIMKFKL